MAKQSPLRAYRFWLLGLVLAGAALLVIIVVSSQVKSNPTRFDDTEDLESFNQLLKESLVVYGASDAPHRLIEFASLSCPSCATFHEQWFPQLQQGPIAEGQLQVIVVGYPLNQPALLAQVLLLCVSDATVRQNTIDFLYTQANQWLHDQYGSALADIFALAGLNEIDFAQCVSDETINDQIFQTAELAGSAFAINATPSFVLDGKKIVQYATFAELIDFIMREVS